MKKILASSILLAGCLAGFAQSATIKASSQQSPYPARLAYDGVAKTFWVSKNKPSKESPESLELVFDSPKKIENLQITGRSGYGPHKGEIQVSSDGVNWTSAAPFTMEDGTPHVVEVDKTAKHVRSLFYTAYDRGKLPAQARSVHVAELKLNVSVPKNAAFVSFIPVTDGNPATDENGYAGSGINAVSYNQNNLLTVGDQQFIAFYRRHATDPDHPQNNTVAIGRRNINSSKWEIFPTKFYSYNIDDEHDVISFAIDGDGFMHMSWGMHSDNPKTKPFQYAKSTTSVLAANPIVMTWLGPKGMTGHEELVCYPRFQVLPDGDVLFLFRKVWSGDGDWYLNRYDIETDRWTPVHADANGKEKRLFLGRGPRPNNCFYGDRFTLGPDGVLHLSGVFRYNSDSPTGHKGFQTNHRYVYLRSLDEGVTWQRMDGTPIALPAVNKIGFVGHDATHVPGIIEDIPEGSSLINQSGMTTDSAGRPIIASWWIDDIKEGGYTRQQQIFFWDGTAWQKRTVTKRKPPAGNKPISEGQLKHQMLSRPIVVTDADDRIIVIYTDHQNHGILVSHSEPLAVDPERKKWTQFNLTHENLGIWEATYDEARWKKDGVLQMLYQKMPGSGKRYTTQNKSTPVSVIEWNARKYFKNQK